MEVLKIIGIVLLSLVLLIILLLYLPIYLKFQFSDKKDFAFSVRFLFLTFGDKKKDKKTADKIKKATGAKDIERAEKKKNKLPFTLSEIIELLRAALEKIIWLCKKARISRCSIKYITAGENAAIDYGTACAVIYPLIGYMQSSFKFSEKRLDLNIACDYAKEKAEYDVLLVVRLKGAHLLRVAMHILIKYLKSK